MAEILAQDILDRLRLAHARNAEPGLGHQIRDSRLGRAEQHQMLGNAIGIEIVQPVPAVTYAGAVFVPG
jgi:hypothetical protein